MKPVFGPLARGEVDGGILVGHPAGIDRVHVDAIDVIVAAEVRVIMLSAALAMLVCGCRVGLGCDRTDLRPPRR
jgi:hypothetical protein